MTITDGRRTWPVTRRRFLGGSAACLGAAAAPFGFPAIAQGGRPTITHGVQSGDVTSSRAIIWSRADRPARMLVEVAATDSFRNARTIVGPAALEDSDFAAKLDLADLPPGQDVFYRVRFRDLDSGRALSEPAVGRLRTAPLTRRTVTFLWSGDTAGQGWGINPDLGGMRCYATMRAHTPDFFIHSGDIVYADNPIQAEVALADGGVWRSLVIPEKSKVAETLEEFRGQYKYNLMDEHLRRFHAEVPVLAQWDDHETTNNWFPDEILDDPRYTVKSCALLAARANRAFHEFLPTRPFADDGERLFRVIPYGPLLDVFMLDMRSYRADNGPNRQTEAGPETAFLGARQVAWLKRQLLDSRATWKVIAADMPIGVVVADGATAFENLANGDGPALGRELEMADLLRFMKLNGIRNTVWLTADVHYTAAHHYDPARARFTEFEPFWEFVSGPLHAGSFGPNPLDDTFGPQVVFQKSAEGRRNLPPSAGLQFFGLVRIDGDTEVMTVVLKDMADADLYRVDLTPAV
jgi:alkaline phosphatase D